MSPTEPLAASATSNARRAAERVTHPTTTRRRRRCYDTLAGTDARRNFRPLMRRENTRLGSDLPRLCVRQRSLRQRNAPCFVTLVQRADPTSPERPLSAKPSLRSVLGKARTPSYRRNLACDTSDLVTYAICHTCHPLRRLRPRTRTALIGGEPPTRLPAMPTPVPSSDPDDIRRITCLPCGNDGGTTFLTIPLATSAASSQTSCSCELELRDCQATANRWRRCVHSALHSLTDVANRYSHFSSSVTFPSTCVRASPRCSTLLGVARLHRALGRLAPSDRTWPPCLHDLLGTVVVSAFLAVPLSTTPFFLAGSAGSVGLCGAGATAGAGTTLFLASSISRSGACISGNN